MSINEEFFIERQGRRMVLYAGLLQEAHERGLYEMDTELLQTPDESNGKVAIVKATARLRGKDGEDFEWLISFSGIGDASPDNVGKNIAPHLIRMAETRAKARALRDAINVGVTAFEELGGEDVVDERRGSAPSQNNAGGSTGGPTPKQASYLKQLIEEKGSLEVFVGKYGEVEDLSRQEASSWIERLKG